MEPPVQKGVFHFYSPKYTEKGAAKRLLLIYRHNVLCIVGSL